MWPSSQLRDQALAFAVPRALFHRVFPLNPCQLLPHIEPEARARTTLSQKHAHARVRFSHPSIMSAHLKLLRTAGKTTESKEIVEEEMFSTSERAAEREAISSRVLMRVSTSISFILVCRSSCEGTA